MPANAFGSMVHCLAVAGSDLWCCTGGGTIAVVDLVTLQVKTKVRSASATYQHVVAQTCSGNTATFLQGFAAHNGEILTAAVIPSSNSMGSIVLTGGHDWQVSDGVLYLHFDLGLAPSPVPTTLDGHSCAAHERPFSSMI